MDQKFIQAYYYSYDTNNRLLRERKDYTSGNADTEIYRYTYDNNGNQIRKVSNKITANATAKNMSVGIYLASENSGYDVEKRTYDVYNRLTEVKKNNSTLGNYTYLPNDLRLSKTVGNNTTYFMWSGDDILAELNGSYAVTAQYVYGTERIYNCINNNYYLYNNHGDTSEVTNANGIVVKSYSLNGFDAYGDEKNPDSNDTNPFRYCGEYYDAETGNIYLRARYYDPSIGGFITEDPARDGVNWYSYCKSNPINRVDPSGLKDYIYTSKDDYYIENDWGMFDCVNPDRYSIEVDEVIYRVNSIETVERYFGASESERSIDMDFGKQEMFNIMLEAQERGVSVIDVLGESISGYLDLKLELDYNCLYNINEIYYNSNEAGNYMWSFMLRLNDYPQYFDGLLAQAGSILGKEHRLDESWDVVARQRGEFDAERWSLSSVTRSPLEILQQLAQQSDNAAIK